MKWFAIFKTGKHTDSKGNTKEWTEVDLDNIVKKYDPQKHEAPIVIGHPETNAPAFGWIDKLKRVGDTLYALPKQLASEFVELVQKGAFKKRSISLYPDGSLRHVGFLGAAAPAVKGLPDVEFSGDENVQTLETENFNDIDEEDEILKKIKELESEISQYQEKLKNFEEMKNKAAEAENLKKELETLNADKESLKKEIEQIKRQNKIKEFAEFVNKKIEEGRLLPKMSGNIAKLYEVVSSINAFEFSEGKTEQPEKLLMEFIESLPVLINLNEQGKKNETPELPPSKILADEIRKNMK
jgi:hypothetical protein